MVIKHSRVLGSCIGGTYGSIFIGGYDGSLVELILCGSCSKCPFIFVMEGGNCLDISWAVRPFQVVKFPLLIA